MLDAGGYVEGQIDSFNSKGLAAIKRAIGAFITSLVRPIATLTEALCRTNFGERYFGLWNVIAGVGILVYFSIPGPVYRKLNAALWNETWNEPWRFYDYLTLILGLLWIFSFVRKGIQHLKRNRERSQTGVLWHSYCYGCSTMSPFKQPWIPIVFGFILICCHIFGIGLLMWYSGWISLLSRLWEAKLMYERVLNTIDARIEQEQLADAVLKKGNGSDTSGFVAPLPAYVSTSHRQKFLQAMAASKALPSPQLSATAPAREPIPPAASIPANVNVATIPVAVSKPAGVATPTSAPPPAPKPASPSASVSFVAKTSDAIAAGPVVPEGRTVTFQKFEPQSAGPKPASTPPAVQQPGPKPTQTVAISQPPQPQVPPAQSKTSAVKSPVAAPPANVVPDGKSTTIKQTESKPEGPKLTPAQFAEKQRELDAAQADVMARLQENLKKIQAFKVPGVPGVTPEPKPGRRSPKRKS